MCGKLSPSLLLFVVIAPAATDRAVGKITVCGKLSPSLLLFAVIAPAATVCKHT